MTTSFIAALGGLRAHQSWIDVIGDNLANSNTPGFKSSRALFADLISVTKRSATPPVGPIGGTNPLQVGLGVQVSGVDRRFEQGALDLTGRTFDLALLGRGFFAVNDGDETLYTRVGTFGLDGEGTMIDLRSGYRVLDQNGQTFTIDTDRVIPPSATTEMDLKGNLPAVVTGPLAEELTSESTFQSGIAAFMTGANTGPFNIPAGETWTMELIVNSGAPQTVAIQGNGAITTQEVVDAINNQTEDVVATIEAGGEIRLESEKTGLASTIKVNAGETGKDLKSMVGLTDFVQGDENPAVAATTLNQLTANTLDYAPGDVIDISGTDVDGSPIAGSFRYGAGFDGETLPDFAQFINNLYGQAIVSFDEASGKISVLAGASGEANLSLVISDAPNQAGRTDWAQHFFSVSTNGTGPDTVTASSEYFTQNGESNVVTFTFVRGDDPTTWTIDASVEGDPGAPITSGQISFNANGTPSSITPPTVTINGVPISISLGDAGLTTGITHYGDPQDVFVASQDGYPSGDLAGMEVQANGSILGLFTNGQTADMGSFAVATFTNASALESVGDSLFRVTANTGDRVLGEGLEAGAGEVVGGAIESSNVDTAIEFVNMIQAQRGFQANARVITVQDELLAEVVNVV